MGRIESAFPHVNTLIRGNRIVLTATEPRGDREASQVYDLLAELVQAAYQAPLDADQVGRLLDHRRMGDSTLTGAVPVSVSGRLPRDRRAENNDRMAAGRVRSADEDREVGGAGYAPEGIANGGSGVHVESQSAVKSDSWNFDSATDRRIAGGNGAKPGQNGDDGIPGGHVADGMTPDTDHRDSLRQAGYDEGTPSETTFSVASVMRSPLAYSSKGPIRPKTTGQMAYVSSIQTHTITFGIGPAGTGKTYLAVAKAVQAFRAKQVSRIILTRPAVEAGESLGFLPGTLNEKVDPYLRPLYDALSDMLGAERMHHYLSNETIEVAPLAYMRGRTLNDAFVILDEAQNTTRQQMKMFLTRLGFNTKMVITGDITQVDLGLPTSGLATIEEILGGIDDIAFVHLEAGDVVRNRLVGKIVQAYDKAGAKADRRPDKA
ncbi:MAG: PhoH family protein [Bifidobacteriales bacterium]|nr:PhoH family protein [Bifidobacteriales bacterium]